MQDFSPVGSPDLSFVINFHTDLAQSFTFKLCFSFVNIVNVNDTASFSLGVH